MAEESVATSLTMFRLAIQADVYLNVPATSEEQAIEMGKKIAQLYKYFGTREFEVELADLPSKKLTEDERKLLAKIDHDDIVGYFAPDGEVSVEDAFDVPDEMCAYCGETCPEEPADSPNLCDGFAGDIDGLYEDNEDDE